MKGMDRVPQDIFREIIQYAYVYSPTQQEHEPHCHYQLTVPASPILASHVCRSWRRVLLSDPTMWTCILVPQINPDGIKELLRRSNSALLNVFFEPNALRGRKHEETSNMLSTIFQQIHRFKTLYVFVFPMWSSSKSTWAANPKQAAIKQILPYLQRPAPKLQYFCFKHMGFMASMLNLGETFMDTLFSGEAQNLKHMHHELFNGVRRQLRPNPLLRNLSELYLTTPNDSFDIDSDLLLDLFEQLPCLELFSLQINWDLDFDVGATRPTRDREINLPHLQRLVLNVNRAIKLLYFLLSHLSFPSNIKWKITSDPGGTSPALRELLSQVQFTSLRILFPWNDFVALSFKKNCDTPCIDPIDDHDLVYVYDSKRCISLFWDLFWQSVEPSIITHLEIILNTGEYSPNLKSFKTIFTSLTNLETLFVRQARNEFLDDGEEETSLVCLSALLPGSKRPKASKRGSKTRRTSTFKTPPLCPRLCKITVEMEDSLSEAHADAFRAFSDKRREEGYPLQLLVRCPEIEDDVQRPEDSIHISIVPWDSDDE